MMKKTQMLAAALICGTAIELAAAPKAEEIASARIFAVDYTKSQESVKAQLAKGKPDGTLLPAGRLLRFDFDPLSTTNYGLQVGADRAAVRYEGKGNFPTRGGTIEMTIKNCERSRASRIFPLSLLENGSASWSRNTRPSFFSPSRRRSFGITKRSMRLCSFFAVAISSGRWR